MPRQQTGSSYGDRMRDIADKYEASGQPWPATSRQIAIWAIDHGLWKPQPSALVDRCADELARAMREDYFTDAQGRRVRAKHAARIVRGGVQQTLWADIRNASRSHMLTALQQRRQQIVGDCWQLKCDADSFNENVQPSSPIQLVFDFTEDMAELEAITQEESWKAS